MYIHEMSKGCERSGAPNRDDTSEELDHLDSMIPMAVVKVETIANLPYRDSVFLGVVFEDKLFEVEKSTFVGYFLSNLNHGFPSILGS